ncbi:16S rRNA (uracil(1498)-N(3))-methyltransferase [Pectinatus sottacetonis]|uniref:16S rRNA (uracil(1498)-N(3))-methyltransferase n=1 Tax=Pectinatus sottacetonis TaxID=1002795 RepID=UPI0018C6CB11|nr:16S rRNA (uracil(1498)-N(3))-methyltransferase [Pectinatus sottacetonis]
MRRLFIDRKMEKKIIITGDDAAHLLYAMRSKPGQYITVVDKEGRIARTSIADCGPQKVDLDFVEWMDKAENESSVNITLMQCLPKGDKMDYIVQKAVELGITCIIPVESQNCVVKYDAAKKEKRCQKWQKTAKEAAKQCGRSTIPEIVPITNLSEGLNHISGYAACVCYESEANISFKQYLQTHNKKNGYLVLIGPEGGFTAEEIEICRTKKIESVSLGKRILRTETAAVAALSILQYEKGDLGS